MSLKQLMQDVFGTPKVDASSAGAASGNAPAEGPHQRSEEPGAQPLLPGSNPMAPPHAPAPAARGRGSLPPPPGARPSGTGTEPMLQHPGTQAGHAPPPAHAENAPYAAQVPRHAQVPQHTQVPDAGMPAFPPYRPHGGQAPPPVYAAGARAADASAPHRVDDARSTTLFPVLAGLGVFVSTLGVALIVVASSVGSAKTRLISPDAESRPLVAIAQEAEVAYCTKDFKEVLERVLHSCGLSTGNERRGCKPADIKTFAAISDADFNALFHPLEDRGGVLMFGEGEHELDQDAKELLEKRWFDRRGARYFFVVARASRTGTPSKNRALSHRRANSVMFHLEEVSGESRADLAKKVGLLWLGNEYAQLSADYCSWPLSRPGEKCEDEAINRSAFVSWVDCRL